MNLNLSRTLAASVAAGVAVLSLGAVAPASATETPAPSVGDTETSAPVEDLADCEPGSDFGSCGELPGDTKTVCADSVRVEQWIPGTGTALFKGGYWATESGEKGERIRKEPLRVNAGHTVLVDKQFAHAPGTLGDYCGSDETSLHGGKAAYDADPDFKAGLTQYRASEMMSELLWGSSQDGNKVWDGLTNDYRLGQYGYRVTTTYVACEMQPGEPGGPAVLGECGEPEVAMESEDLTTMFCYGPMTAGLGATVGEDGWPVEDAGLAEALCAAAPAPEPAPVPDPAPEPEPTPVPDPVPPRIDAGAAFAAPAGDTTAAEGAVAVGGLVLGLGAFAGLLARARRRRTVEQ